MCNTAARWPVRRIVDGRHRKLQRSPGNQSQPTAEERPTADGDATVQAAAATAPATPATTAHATPRRQAGTPAKAQHLDRVQGVPTAVVLVRHPPVQEAQRILRAVRQQHPNHDINPQEGIQPGQQQATPPTPANGLQHRHVTPPPATSSTPSAPTPNPPPITLEHEPTLSRNRRRIGLCQSTAIVGGLDRNHAE